jgi:hypothetical protein
MSDDVGTIRVHGGEATLGSDMRWRGDPDLARVLNLSRGSEPRSPADGDPGAFELARAARRLRGEIIAYRPPPPGEPGTVY